MAGTVLESRYSLVNKTGQNRYPCGTYILVGEYAIWLVTWWEFLRREEEQGSWLGLAEGDKGISEHLLALKSHAIVVSPCCTLLVLGISCNSQEHGAALTAQLLCWNTGPLPKSGRLHLHTEKSLSVKAYSGFVFPVNPPSVTSCLPWGKGWAYICETVCVWECVQVCACVKCVQPQHFVYAASRQILHHITSYFVSIMIIAVTPLEALSLFYTAFLCCKLLHTLIGANWIYN